jgi:hypothetical protein
MALNADVIRSLPEDPDLTVEIATGTEHFRNGAIALTVRGDANRPATARPLSHRRSRRGARSMSYSASWKMIPSVVRSPECTVATPWRMLLR